MRNSKAHATQPSLLVGGKSVRTDDVYFVRYKSNPGGLPRTQGFTLLELLIVLAILAVLLGMAVNNYARYRSRLELQQAQQTFIQTLNRARSDAKRLSQNQSISWTDKVLTVGEKNITLSESSGVTLVKITGANTLTYTAPYGRVASVGEYEFELQGRGDLTSKVYVYGVTGKVKAAQ